MKSRAALVLLVLLGCSNELEPGTCLDGQDFVMGRCRRPCIRDNDCLLSETCQSGACIPAIDRASPEIRLFQAQPDTVEAGGSTTIDWVVLFAETVEIAGFDGASTIQVLPPTSQLAGTVPLDGIAT